MSKYWEIEEGKVDSAKFFRALAMYFPDATSLFAEGTVISDDVKACYASHHEEGKYLPGRHTIFPVSKKYRCRFSQALMAQLADLAEVHAEPELLDHLALYKDYEEVLVWHDAFANVLLVARTVPEDVVSQFAAELGLGYGEA